MSEENYEGGDPASALRPPSGDEEDFQHVPLDPEDIEIAQLLSFVSENSPYDLGVPHSKKDTPIRFASQKQIDNKNVVALSSSKAILDLIGRRIESSKHMEGATRVGRIPQANGPKSSMYLYEVCDGQITTDSAKWPDLPAWLGQVQHYSRSYVRDGDLAQLEKQSRELVAICSSMDAYVSALANVLNNPDPFVTRLLHAIGNGIADTSRRTTNMLQQLTLHRRDMALWHSHVKSEQFLALRFAPFVGEKFIFPPQVLREVGEVREEEIRNKAMFKVATAAAPVQQQGDKRYSQDNKQGVKRNVTTKQEKYPGEFKQRRFNPAFKKPATQVSTNTSTESKSYR